MKQDNPLNPNVHCCAEMYPGSGIRCGRHKGHDAEKSDTGHRQRGADGGQRWHSAVSLDTETRVAALRTFIASGD